MPGLFDPRNRRWLVLGGVALAALLLGVVVVLAGGGDEETAPTTTIATGRPTTTTAPPVFPLTGLADTKGAGEDRPVLAVKIDNSDHGRPQAGLEDADVVYEEEVEGGITRFIALFHSVDPKEVGPVRSVRPMDPQILSPLGGLFAFSGGIPAFVQAVRTSPVQPVSQDDVPRAYERKPGRRAPTNLFASSGDLWDAARTSEPPPALFGFLGEGEVFGGQPASGVTIRFSERAIARYTYDAASEGWLRETNGTPHVSESGTRISADNVIVQRVTTRDTGFTDPSHSPVIESVVVGEGEALCFSQGRMITGRWSKPAASAVTTYTDASGKPILLEPGRTWVHFVTTSGSVESQTAAPTGQ